MENLEKLFLTYQAGRYKYPNERRGAEEALFRGIVDALAKCLPASAATGYTAEVLQNAAAIMGLNEIKPEVLEAITSPRPPTPGEHYQAARKARGRPPKASMPPKVVSEVADNG